MFDLMVKWVGFSAVLMAAAALMPKVRIQTWGAAFLGVAVFGAANVLLGGILSFVAKILFALPNLLTLGLIWLLIPVAVNMILLRWAIEATDEGIEVEGLGALATLALTLTVTGGAMNALL